MTIELELAIGLKAGLYESTESPPPSVGPLATILREVIVPDVSFYQHTINFAKMRSNAASGVIIRAGQNTWRDNAFASHWPAARAAGLPRGSYWFFDSRSEPERQADLWTQIIAPDLGEMEHWADYEEVYGGPFGGWNMLYRFMSRMQTNLPNIKLGLYTGYYYWLEHSPANPDSLAWFAQFPLWLAWYTDNPANVRIPPPWTDLLYWQYTHTGSGPAYGVDTLGIDLNNFNGTKSQFSARYNLPAPPPEPPPPPPGGEIDTLLIEQRLQDIEAAVTAIRTEIGNVPPPATRQANIVAGITLNVRSDHVVINNPSNVVGRMTAANNPVTVYEEWRSPDGREVWVRVSDTQPRWAAMVYRGSVNMVYI
ncbi:MAG: glycoside hydrolase family 25 protein [Chloroflexota bacterium]